ncbi:MAG: DUF6602 domain-containing protein [Methanofastidiosum sp.]
MVESDIREYFESIGVELESIKNRVRNLIGSANWGEEGRYKEAILKNTIRRVLPKDISIATGFVVYKENEIVESTKQLDLILYDNSYPVLFKEGDFVILTSEPIRGIIEIKTKINGKKEFGDILNTAHENMKKIISSKKNNPGTYRFFKGIFSFDSDLNNEIISKSYRNHFISIDYDPNYVIDYVCLNPNIFAISRHRKFEIYEFKHLAPSYFITSLLKCIKCLEMQDSSMWYPYPDKSEYMVKSVSLRRE